MPKKGIAETEKVGLPPLSMPDGVRLGAHLSIAGGTWNALVRARALGCNAVQLFVKNANQWAGKPLGSDEGARFRAEWESAGRPVCFAHNSYLTNLAAAGDALWEKSIAALVDEVRRCAALGLLGIVVHPGAAGEQGEREAIERVGAALTEVFRRTSDVGVEVWLETTGGQGSALGWRFEQLTAQTR